MFVCLLAYDNCVLHKRGPRTQATLEQVSLDFGPWKTYEVLIEFQVFLIDHSSETILRALGEKKRTNSDKLNSDFELIDRLVLLCDCKRELNSRSNSAHNACTPIAKRKN